MRVSKQDLLRSVRRALAEDIADFGVEKLGGDASDRNYYRLHLTSGGTHPSRTLVVMELQDSFDGEALPFLNVLHTLERSGLGVPRLYGCEPGQGVIFLEDLGDEILQKKIQGQKPDSVETLYHEALDIIVQIQCEVPASSGCIAFKTVFTVERFVWELDFFRAHYIEGLLGQSIHPGDRTAMDRLFFWLATVMDGEKKVFTHRDYHSRNLIYHAGRLKVIDFQDARMGLAQYDVASLLRDSYVVLDDGLVESLLEYYVSKLEGTSGKRIDRLRFRYLFDMTSVQRNLKAIGTFAYQAVERKNPTYLKYIPATLTYVDKNLHRYEELASYREILERYLPFPGG